MEVRFGWLIPNLKLGKSYFRVEVKLAGKIKGANIVLIIKLFVIDGLLVYWMSI